MVPKWRIRVHKGRGCEAAQLCFANSVDCRCLDEIGSEIIKKSFKTCGIKTSDVNKIHCLKEVQPTEEARMLSDELSGNLEFIARPTLDDDVYEIMEL